MNNILDKKDYMNKPRGRPRKLRVLSGAERASRYRARQQIKELEQISELLNIFKNSNEKQSTDQ